jgi:hypothetical protein
LKKVKLFKPKTFQPEFDKLLASFMKKNPTVSKMKAKERVQAFIEKKQRQHLLGRSKLYVKNTI